MFLYKVFLEHAHISFCIDILKQNMIPQNLDLLTAVLIR